jgi:hypothetical protein
VQARVNSAADVDLMPPRSNWIYISGKIALASCPAPSVPKLLRLPRCQSTCWMSVTTKRTSSHAPTAAMPLLQRIWRAIWQPDDVAHCRIQQQRTAVPCARRTSHQTSKGGRCTCWMRDARRIPGITSVQASSGDHMVVPSGTIITAA